MLRRLLWTGAVLVAVAASLWMWLSQQAVPTSKPTYEPVFPRIGDYATVDLQVNRWDSRQREAHYLRTVPLRIECVDSGYKRCVFKVNYRESGKSAKLAYTVCVKYYELDLDRRCTVLDREGKKVEHWQLVDGNPVPFRRFLVFNEAWDDKCLPAKDGLRAYIRRRDTGSIPPHWRTSIGFRSGATSANIYSQDQAWAVDEWLWMSADGKESGLSWSAYRTFISDTKNFHSGSGR